MSKTTTTTLSMKLLIDTKKKRVLFAEADKDVVDFLFSLLALPVATIVRMLGKESMCGSIGNLYTSVENLDCKLVLPSAEKKALLQPTIVPSAATTSAGSLLLPAPSYKPPPKSFYRCSESSSNYSYSCRSYVTDSRTASCPNCGKKMTTTLSYVPPPPVAADGTGGGPSAIATAKGFAQGMVTYTVRDNLMVTSMSTISTISLLNTLAVTDFAALQEKTVQLGYTEGLQILKASLQSNTVLTDVFLSKKRPRRCA